jgi:hypothetical protein
MGTSEGMGDTTVALTRTFSPKKKSDLYIDVTGRVRLPTGDEDKGLGVGVTDTAVALEVGAAGRKHGAYVNLARRFLGERDDLERTDGWQARVGGWVKVDDKTTIGASYYWRNSSFKDGEEPSEVGVYVSRKLTKDVDVSLDAGFGLSDASADSSVGLRFTWRSGRKGK